MGAVILALERGGCEVERRGLVARLKRGERGAEAVEREGEVVSAWVRVRGGRRVGGDCGTEEGRGGPGWRGG